MREAGSKWMRMRHSLLSGSQTMLLLTVPSVILSFGWPIENITAGIIVLDFAAIESMQWALYPDQSRGRGEVIWYVQPERESFRVVFIWNWT